MSVKLSEVNGLIKLIEDMIGINERWPINIKGVSPIPDRKLLFTVDDFDYIRCLIRCNLKNMAEKGERKWEEK